MTIDPRIRDGSGGQEFVNPTYHGGREYKDRCGINMKTKRSLHLSPEWYKSRTIYSTQIPSHLYPNSGRSSKTVTQVQSEARRLK